MGVLDWLIGNTQTGKVTSTKQTNSLTKIPQNATSKVNTSKSHQSRVQDDIVNRRKVYNSPKFGTTAVSNGSKKKSSDGSQSSSGNGITDTETAGEDSLSGDTGVSDGSSDSGTSSESDSSSSGTTSPLLEGTMTFEKLIQEICDGIDIIFVCKRSTVVVTDYAGIYAEAKYLRDNYKSSVQAEDIALWQLEDGTYELEVSEYGFYNTVIVEYKNGVVKESYDDLVRVYDEVPITYVEKKLDKTSAIMKAKAYLAAHVRDFDMSVKANLLHDADVDIGDIVTLENPMTMRDSYRQATEGRDPEYFFVTANSISWDEGGPILNSIELRYGAKSPEKKDVPEVGTGGYTESESTNSDVSKAVDEVGKLASKIKYSHACQTHDCVQSKGEGDCHGMSDYIACELKSRGVDVQIKEYATSAASNHRSVLYKDTTGNWVRFPYRKYGVNKWFRDTNGVNNGSDVQPTC